MTGLNSALKRKWIEQLRQVQLPPVDLQKRSKLAVVFPFLMLVTGLFQPHTVKAEDYYWLSEGGTNANRLPNYAAACEYYLQALQDYASYVCDNQDQYQRQCNSAKAYYVPYNNVGELCIGSNRYAADINSFSIYLCGSPRAIAAYTDGGTDQLYLANPRASRKGSGLALCMESRNMHNTRPDPLLPPALRQAVNALRKALHDESKTPHFILAACKRGYRFLPDVTVEVGPQGSVATTQAVGLHYRPKTEFPDVSQEHDVELAQLLKAFEQAANGKKRLVFLNGEQGIGKTALIERFLAKISHSEFAVLRARCVQLGGVVEPFLPLLEALELRCREPCGKSLIDCLHQIAPTWLYQMLNVLEPEEIATLQPKVSHINSGRMLREGADFFEKLGTESTLVLILDNSQWSDEFTLDLLNFLVFRNSSTRLLMIVSYRPNEGDAGARRLEAMREELCRRGLSQELTLHRR